MIARVWSARATEDNAPRYRTHLRDAVLPVVQRLPGYLGAMLLERAAGHLVEITVITRWASLDDVRAFAGVDLEKAVVADDARALLTEFDERVQHAVVSHEDRI